MQIRSQKRWLAFWVCFLAALITVTLCYAGNVDLIAYVTYSLKDSSGTPLADGSYVAIFGSTDNINDGPAGLGPTNLIADSTTGDDVFLGWVRIDMPSYLGSNGTFYTANVISFDDTVVNYLYIRFFDTTDYPVQGYQSWGTSTVFGYTSIFGKAEVDFVGNYLTTMTNNFVIIPEPGTANLLVLFLGLVTGLHTAMKKGEKKRT